MAQPRAQQGPGQVEWHRRGRSHCPPGAKSKAYAHSRGAPCAVIVTIDAGPLKSAVPSGCHHGLTDRGRAIARRIVHRRVFNTPVQASAAGGGPTNARSWPGCSAEASSLLCRPNASPPSPREGAAATGYPGLQHREASPPPRGLGPDGPTLSLTTSAARRAFCIGLPWQKAGADVNEGQPATSRRVCRRPSAALLGADVAAHLALPPHPGATCTCVQAELLPHDGALAPAGRSAANRSSQPR